MTKNERNFHEIEANKNNWNALTPLKKLYLKPVEVKDRRPLLYQKSVSLVVICTKAFF